MKLAPVAQMVAPILAVVLLPLLAATALRLGPSPGPDDVRQRLRDLSPEREKELEVAVWWKSQMVSLPLLSEALPLLQHPDSGIREEAYLVIGRTNDVAAFPHLERMVFEDKDNMRAALKTYKSIQYPGAEPFFRRIAATHPDPIIRERAINYISDQQEVINFNESYFSTGIPATTRLGQLIFSQAILFPEGQAQAAEEREKP
jgi:hypothetical protein